jgi:hypothetical protein
MLNSCAARLRFHPVLLRALLIARISASSRKSRSDGSEDARTWFRAASEVSAMWRTCVSLPFVLLSVFVSSSFIVIPIFKNRASNSPLGLDSLKILTAPPALAYTQAVPAADPCRK